VVIRIIRKRKVKQNIVCCRWICYVKLTENVLNEYVDLAPKFWKLPGLHILLIYASTPKTFRFHNPLYIWRSKWINKQSKGSTEGTRRIECIKCWFIYILIILKKYTVKYGIYHFLKILDCCGGDGMLKKKKKLCKKKFYDVNKKKSRVIRVDSFF